MAESIKLKNDTYWDTSGIAHNKKILKDIVIVKDDIARLDNVVSRNKAGLKEIAWQQSMDYINIESNGIKYKAKAEQYTGFNLVLSKSLEIGKEYTISFKNNSSNNISFNIVKTNTAWQYDYDNSYVKSYFVDANASYSYTFTAETSLVGIMFICSTNSNADTNERDIIDIQLDEGSAATSYVPYLNLEELQEKTNDTGWRDITFYSGFSSFADWTVCKARKIGDVVYIKGAVKGFSTINYTQFAKLPSDFRGNIDTTVQFIVSVINKASAIAVLNINMNTGIMVLTSANSSVSSSDGININCSFCLY